MARDKLGRVEAGSVAVVAYRLSRGDDSVVEQSTEAQPLVYLHGEGQIAKALEEAFGGREVGATFEAEISPDGFVPPNQAAGLRVIPRDALPEGATPTVGDELKLAEEDQTYSVWITEVGEHRLQVSLAPPWGDDALTLKGEILKVRPATADELRAKEATRIEADASSKEPATESE